MKKTLGISIIALLTLSSCTSSDDIQKTPEEAITNNQVETIKTIENLISKSPLEGISKGIITLDIDSKEGKLKGDINYDFKFNQIKQESAGNIKLSLDGNSDSKLYPVESIKGDLSVDLVTLKNKLIFKLNSLSIDKADENPQLAMITGMAAPFLNKWYFMDLSKGTDMPYNQQSLIQNKDKILKILKNNTILNNVQTNENADYYDYNVNLNADNIIKIIKEIDTLINKKAILTESDTEEYREGINEFNKESSLNLKINKENAQYFIFTVSDKEDKNINTKFILENTKTDFNITFNDSDNNIVNTFKGNKSKNKINGLLIFKEENKELFNGKLNLGFDGTNTTFILDGIANQDEEELKIKLDFSDKSIKSSVKIEEPTGVKDFNEVIGAFIGGAF